MAPWSNGWGTEVVFGGKKMGWKLVKLEIDRYAGQLSRNFLWTLSVKLVYLFLEYLFFFCALNKRGKLFAFSNQQIPAWEVFLVWYPLPTFFLTALLPRALSTFEVIGFVREAFEKETKSISVQNIFSFIIRKNCWQGCPKSNHIVRNWIVFTTHNFKTDVMPKKC